ncbi:MAG TPA: twin-arginine translocase TatA/TatE family subunit [Pyrinomonadaceae bacterium]|jgi:sec-independent protein translocase protein TatB
MHTVLFVFEFLGTTELLVVAVVALILFGPRKLPEIGRTVGKAIGEFKRASDDFKRTWEYEVELEQRKPALDAGAQAAAPGLGSYAGADVPAPAGAGADEATQPDAWETTVARGSADEGPADGRDDAADAPAVARAPRAADDEINAS